jgi:hypothetical protein
MLDALLHGKLSQEQENMEDILTSFVFGMIKYLPPKDTLFPFLAKAELLTDATTTMPLEFLRQEPETTKVDYEFWPRLKEKECNPCEPDVLITITRQKPDPKIFILIEAKYRSGKSSHRDESKTPNDQLAKEWDNLKRRAEIQDAIPYLIYLTADFGFPVEQINESQDELKEDKRGEGKIYWLSWRHFPSTGQSKIAEDISKVLRARLGLKFYEGISAHSVIPITWKFTKLPISKSFEWLLNPVEEIKWKFIK